MGRVLDEELVIAEMEREIESFFLVDDGSFFLFACSLARSCACLDSRFKFSLALPAHLVQNRLHLVVREAHARVDLLDERGELGLVESIGREKRKGEERTG